MPLRVRIVGPRPEKGGDPQFSVRRGQLFAYRVALTSTSRRPFRFERCPVYQQGLGSRDEWRTLNCRPAGTFAPGETKQFEMVLRVPRRAGLGRDLLVWHLVAPLVDPPGGFAEVEVLQ